ncbi:MAG: LysR family transcriptional regulator [Nocardioidaceae bacterium]
MMDLRLLRYFLAIADAGSVTAASRGLLVAQPSLSRQLRRLEADLGLVLFDRTDRRLQLTPAGRSFLPVARDLVNRADVARATARSLAGGGDLRLTLAAPPTTITDIIAPFIVASGPEGPIVNAVEASPHAVFGTLENGQADLAIGTRMPPAGLRHQVVGRAYVWAECAPEHPLATEESVDLATLVEWPLVLMHEDHGVRRMFDDAVTREGLAYQAEYVTRTPHVAQALAAAGRGVCVLSDDARFGLRELPIVAGGAALSITLFAAWDPTHYASAKIAGCVESLGRFTRELYEPGRQTT